jgi:hypothetical protein
MAVVMPTASLGGRASHVALIDPLRLADLTDRSVHAVIEQLLPSPRPRQRLDERCRPAAAWSSARSRSRLALRCAYDLAAVGNAWGSVRPACCHPALSLGALPHAAFLSPCCRSSPTRLARPSALIRTRARSPARRPARPGAERFAPARRRTACSRPQRGRRAPTNLRRCSATAGPGECDEFQDLRTAPRPALGSLFRSRACS